MGASDDGDNDDNGGDDTEPELRPSHVCEMVQRVLRDYSREISEVVNESMVNIVSPIRWMIYLIDGLVQDCINSSVLAMDLLKSCTEPSIPKQLLLHVVLLSSRCGLLSFVTSKFYPYPSGLRNRPIAPYATSPLQGKEP